MFYLHILRSLFFYLHNKNPSHKYLIDKGGLDKYSDFRIATINNDLIVITMYSCFLLKAKIYTSDLLLHERVPLLFF